MNLQKSGFHGFYLPDAGIALDGPLPDGGDAVFISHAHADHAPRNRGAEVYASPATAALIRARGHKGPVNEVPFGETVSFPRADVTLYPAGHILGSAMIYIVSESGSMLYTGDCRTPPSPTSEGFELPDAPVDHLVIEATFGLPIYKWAPHEQLFAQIRDFARNALNDGATPVLLCYNLGKAQEVMHALAGACPEMAVQIHGAGAPLCRVYESFGINLGRWEPYDKSSVPGKALITPASTADTAMVQNIRNARIAYVSGWASLEARASQLLADALIPLSDHLDFFELLDTCRKCNPGHVYLTHSPNPDVALHFLEQEGFSCSSLDLEMIDDG